MAKISLLERVRASIPVSGRYARWESQVPPEHHKTLEEIKQAWIAGEFGERLAPASKGIAKFLREEGIASIGHDGVARWLQSE